jgi:hypothetical protein
MRLKRTLNRTVGEKRYHKWLISDVPPAIVDELGWQPNQELEAVPRADGLLIRRVK